MLAGDDIESSHRSSRCGCHGLWCRRRMQRRRAGQRQDTGVKASHGFLKLFDGVSQVRGLILLHATPALYVPPEITIVEGENLSKVCTPSSVGMSGPVPIASAIWKAGREANTPRLTNGRIAHGIIA